MKISADFTVIPDAFAKAAPPENCIDGTPIVSFPFYIDELDPSVQFLHWEFVDPDSIPVCGFQWNHWSLANLPVDALMYVGHHRAAERPQPRLLAQRDGTRVA